ncbi:MAG: thioredoxin [Patescibacteria group bacterium]|jgi:thioredoxin 1
MDKKEFDEIVSKKKVVLVDMFATWCGPCQMMAPFIEEIKKEYEKKDEVEILEVDIDENPEIPAEYSVMSVPTFLIFKDGKLVDTIVGATTKDNLIDKIETNIK